MTPGKTIAATGDDSGRAGAAELALSGEATLALLRAVHERGAAFRFTAQGTSMHPAIQHGDVITVTPMAGRVAVPGDVVAFIHPRTGKLTVHRLLYVRNSAYTVKGDNVPVVDGSIPADKLLGLVTDVTREGYSLPWPDHRARGGWRVCLRCRWALATLWLRHLRSRVICRLRGKR